MSLEDQMKKKMNHFADAIVYAQTPQSGYAMMRKEQERMLIGDFGVRDEYRGADSVPMREVYRLEQECAKSKQYLQQILDARAATEARHKAELAAATKPERDKVVECAMVYVKVQSRRYQRELEEAINAMERTKR